MKISPMGHAWSRSVPDGWFCMQCWTKIPDHYLGNVGVVTLDALDMHFYVPCGAVKTQEPIIATPVADLPEREPWMDDGDYERFCRRVATCN